MIEGHRVIAVEEHFATQAFVDAVADLPLPETERFEMNVMRALQGQGPIHDRLVDFDLRLADMDASGTDLALLSLNPPGVQAYDTEPAVSVMREANDALAEIVRERPDRFAGLGTVAPQDPKRSAREIERVMGPLGLNGLLVSSHTKGLYLDDPQFEPILAAAEAEGATIYLHPRHPSPAMARPYQDYGMGFAVWGFQAEAGIHAVRLILSGVFDRHPSLTFVLGHLGEALPFWLARLDNRYEWTLRAASEQLGMVDLELTPSEYFQRNFVCTTSGMEDPDILALCLRQLGEDNILYAVDFPYEASTEAANALRGATLTDTQRARISHANAERVFGLPVETTAIGS
jgi:5-carboxyvanillate decarboxylase